MISKSNYQGNFQLNYRIYFLFLLLTLSYAQWQGSDRKMPAIGILKGSISDSTSREKIEYASITLINLKSNQIVSGALSNKQGDFLIKEIPLGRYKAVIEFIGYKTQQINPINLFPGESGGIEQNLGDLKLSVSSINLSQVEVLGESQFIQTIDKQIFTVGKNLASSGGSGEDVLNQVPTVAVDIDGNITLRGDANVTVLIDGKKVGFDRRSMVDNLQASMIEKVEVITNPSAKYDPDGVGGIINLVLKRGTFDGFNGNTTLSAGEYNKNNLSGNLNYRTDKWNIFGNASYRIGERYGTGLREFDFSYFEPTDSIRYLYQKTKRLRNSDNVSFRFGGDIYPNSASTISYTSTFNIKDQDGQEIIETSRPITSILDIKEVEEESNWDHSLSYENKFDSKDKKLNGNLSYSYGSEDETENDLSQNSTGNNSSVKNRNNFQSAIASLDYENKFGENFALETGFKTTLKQLGDDLFFLDDTYDYLYDENIYAIYATIGYDLSDRFGVKGGLRFEQVETLAEIDRKSVV